LTPEYRSQDGSGARLITGIAGDQSRKPHHSFRGLYPQSISVFWAQAGFMYKLLDYRHLTRLNRAVIIMAHAQEPERTTSY